MRCDDIFVLFWINYGDVGFMPIWMSDDVVFVLCCFIVESHTFHKRRGLLCQAMMAFMPSDDGFYAERRSALCQERRWALCQKRRWAFMPKAMMGLYAKSDDGL